MKRNKPLLITVSILAGGLITVSAVSAYAFAKSNDGRSSHQKTTTSISRTKAQPKPAMKTSKSKPAAETKPRPQTPSQAPVPAVVTAPTGAGAFRGLKLYVPPQEVGRMYGKMAGKSIAQWFGDWTPQPREMAAQTVSRANAAGQLAVLVAYNIPIRDCNGYSAGGAVSDVVYSKWIGDLAAGIGRNRAIVILEPDALGHLDCLSAVQQASRLKLLSDAVTTLRSQTSASIYIDAGNPRWKPAGVIVAALLKANVQAADGFALNVSNFYSTSENVSYGNAVSALTGGKHYVVDTSRNGNGPAADLQWCNPPGRALGNPPTTETGQPLVDAYLWVKVPGESDGNCNGHPVAGEWSQAYADELMRNAAW
ncbi:MAG TPA: glycoside hydrolase family 6 protein [Candidatus Saccharimonadales bacterium]